MPFEVVFDPLLGSYTLVDSATGARQPLDSLMNLPSNVPVTYTGPSGQEPAPDYSLRPDGSYAGGGQAATFSPLPQYDNSLEGGIAQTLDIQSRMAAPVDEADALEMILRARQHERPELAETATAFLELQEKEKTRAAQTKQAELYAGKYNQRDTALDERQRVLGLVDRGVPYDVALGVAKGDPEAMQKYSKMVGDLELKGRAGEARKALNEKIKIPVQVGAEVKDIEISGYDAYLRGKAPHLEPLMKLAYPELFEGKTSETVEPPAPTSGNALADIAATQQAKKLESVAARQATEANKGTLFSLSLPPSDTIFKQDLMNAVRPVLEAGDEAKIESLKQQLLTGAANPQSGITPPQLAAIKEVLEYIFQVRGAAMQVAANRNTPRF